MRSQFVNNFWNCKTKLIIPLQLHRSWFRWNFGFQIAIIELKTASKQSSVWKVDKLDFRANDECGNRCHLIEILDWFYDFILQFAEIVYQPFWMFNLFHWNDIGLKTSVIYGKQQRCSWEKKAISGKTHRKREVFNAKFAFKSTCLGPTNVQKPRINVDHVNLHENRRWRIVWETEKWSIAYTHTHRERDGKNIKWNQKRNGKNVGLYDDRNKDEIWPLFGVQWNRITYFYMRKHNLLLAEGVIPVWIYDSFNIHSHSCSQA